MPAASRPYRRTGHDSRASPDRWAAPCCSGRLPSERPRLNGASLPLIIALVSLRLITIPDVAIPGVGVPLGPSRSHSWVHVLSVPLPSLLLIFLFSHLYGCFFRHTPIGVDLVRKNISDMGQSFRDR